MVEKVTDAISIRALTADDWREFAAIRLESLKKYPHYFGSTYEREAGFSQADWQDWLGQEGRCVFALYDKGTVIGVTGAVTWKNDPTGTTGSMIASYIKREYQKLGLSAKLYQSRISWALAYQPWKKLVIGHREGNDASRAANQKWNFIFTHKSPRLWNDGKTEDEYLYLLDLEELRRNSLHPIHQKLNEYRI